MKPATKRRKDTGKIHRRHALLVADMLAERIEEHCTGIPKYVGDLTTKDAFVSRIELSCCPRQTEQKREGELVAVPSNAVIDNLLLRYKLSRGENSVQFTYMGYPATIYFRQLDASGDD